MNQVNQRKQVCCLRTRTILITVLSLSLLLISLKILLFFHTSWYYQGKGLKKWEGGLFKVHSSGGLINKKSYALLSEYYCAEKSLFSTNTSVISYNDAEKLCTRFRSLKDGLLAYVIISCLGLFLWIIALVFFLVGQGRKQTLIISLVLICFDIAFEFASLICVVASSDITFEGECSYLSNIDSTNTANPKCCGDQAALFAILLEIFIISFQVWNLVNVCVFISCPRIVNVEPPVEQIYRRKEQEMNNKGNLDYPD